MAWIFALGILVLLVTNMRAKWAKFLTIGIFTLVVILVAITSGP